ncbi:MAG: hypothetical protein JOZ93_18010, partial [Sinobacteraceae bacterium]|nr:hypothetical protein [Nevskiaceae bacterium]
MHAQPHRPVSDGEVLERVPAAAQIGALEALRRRLATRPDDLQSALTLAHGYLALGRSTGDPRLVSYTEATLAPWLAAQPRNAAVLTLQAAALQYLHQFNDSLALLERVTAIEPLNAEAWLMKATILQVQGRLQPAREACRPLLRAAGQLIALTCVTSVNSLNGRLGESQTALRGAFSNDPGISPELRAWMLSVLADMAARAGDSAQAEHDLRTALQLAPQDGFVQAAYADLLLAQRRDPEVLQLLHGMEQQDNLLLRLAIAGTRLNVAQAAGWSRDFQARYETARRAGDATHVREQARFLLEVRGDGAAALLLAGQNWNVQHEPADIQLFVRAALAQHDLQLARPALDWVSHAAYEDVGIRAAIGQTA